MRRYVGIALVALFIAAAVSGDVSHIAIGFAGGLLALSLIFAYAGAPARGVLMLGAGILIIVGLASVLSTPIQLALLVAVVAGVIYAIGSRRPQHRRR